MSRDPIQSFVTKAARAPVRVRVLALALALAALTASSIPAGAFEFSRVQGHMTFGYGRLMIGHSPAGSIGLTTGFDHPASSILDVGVDLGLYLYGNRNVDRGSLNATVDYGAFEVIAFTHWKVPAGPISRVSFGPGLTSARAELSSSAGGAAFLDLAVDEVAPTLALDLTAMRRKPGPVRVAAIAGLRSAFLDGEDWHQFSVRFGFHY
ncbi:MAG: hypothetical protein ABIS67_12885 [Candidatus Eisenbacteria bacterium]